MEDHHGSWLEALAKVLPPWLHPWLDSYTLHTLLVVVLLGVLAWRASRKLSLVPQDRVQTVGEWVYEALLSLTRGILGEHHGRQYVGVIGSFFLFIFGMNLAGLVPGLLSPTARLSTTLGLALMAILIAQFIGLRHNGWRYLKRFTWNLGRRQVPVLIHPLKVLEEVVKPVSLSVRLFGNVFGDDTALVQFAVLGAGALAVVLDPSYLTGSLERLGGLTGTALGISITAMMIAFAMLVAFIQAFVFSLLTGAYIMFAIEME